MFPFLKSEREVRPAAICSPHRRLTVGPSVWLGFPGPLRSAPLAANRAAPKEGNLVHFDDHLTLGGIACALSHRKALRRFLGSVLGAERRG